MTGLPAGIHNVDDKTYFADPAVSHSDLKLIYGGTPAGFRHAKDNPKSRTITPEYEFGHAVHTLALGSGPEIVIVDAGNWRTKAAQEARDEARAASTTPLLVDTYNEAVACVDALRTHAIAGPILANLDHAEVTLVWDEEGGLRLRCKLDGVSGRFVIDVKTADIAEHRVFGRSAAQYGYATQAAFYLEGARRVLGIDDPAFLFLVVEKSPPYLVNVIELDPYDVQLGDRLNRYALNIYRQCLETDTWPGYGDDIKQVSLPRWWEIEQEGL